MRRSQKWWDQWYLGLAKYIATASKDPSTQVGAVIIDEKQRVVSMGFNGFPRGTDDHEDLYENRDIKYQRILHAETNAVLFADRPGHTCYVTHPPCAQCTAMLIQHGIKRIIHCNVDMRPTWVESIRLARQLAYEANIAYLAEDEL